MEASLREGNREPRWHCVNPTLIPLVEADAQEHPNWADLQNRWGLVLLSENEPAAAVPVFERCLEINPRYAWASMNLVAALALSEESKLARKKLDEATEPVPGVRSFMILFLELIAPSGCPLEELEDAVPPGLRYRLDGTRLRAALLKQRGSPGAQEVWEGVMGVPPALTPAISSPWDEDGDPTSRLVSFVPGMHELWLHLSTVVARRSWWGEAKEEAALAYLCWSDRGVYLNQLGYVASIRGEDDAAVRLYEEAAIASPDAPVPYIALAFHFSAVGELEKSFRALQCAVRRAPRYADLHHQMGLLQRGRGKAEEALDAFREALEINPKYALARLDEADTLFELERWEEAKEAYREVLGTGLVSSDIHLHLGQLEQRLGDPKEAEHAFLEALRSNPAEAMAHYHLGNLYRERGDNGNALMAWKRFLSMNPSPELQSEVEAAISEGRKGPRGGSS